MGRVDAKGHIPEWALSNPGKPFAEGFNLALYICRTCGYAELFDLDPETTHNDAVSNE